MRISCWALAVCLSSPAFSQEHVDAPRYAQDELYSEVIHSDLPLYGFDWEEFWPRSFIPEDAIAGCGSRVQNGDWQFTGNPVGAAGDERWWRLTNYGTFHCATIFREADHRDELEDGQATTGYFVQIGETLHAGKVIELWAVQRGSIPGSEYELLAREPGDDVIGRFMVLQQRCPEDAMREYSGNLDISRTDYCAINSREELLAMAIDMLDFPTLGTIERRGDNDWVVDASAGEKEPE